MNIDDIRKKIIDHPSNAWAKELGYRPVFTASESAQIAIVGQAPGIKAQTSGIPWNDVSGDKLREWLEVDKDAFYDTGKFALVPMDFYFPGKLGHGDLPPRKDFAQKWHPQLFKAMPDIKLTILAGQYAQNYYLGDSKQRNLTENVKHYKTYLPDYLPIVHPSPLTIRWRKMNPWFEDQVVPAMRDRVHSILSLK